MHLFCVVILTLCCYLTLSGAQNFFYTDQRRSGGYNRPYASTPSYSLAKPSSSFHNQGKLYPYSGSAEFYKQPSIKGTPWNYERAPSKGNYQQTSITTNPFYNSYLNKKLSSGSVNSHNSNKDNFNQFSTSRKDGKKSISKADAENAKFVGAENQENDEARFLHLKHKKIKRRFHGALTNPCSFYGRDASNSITPPPKEQSRFLWDINVHNYYPQNTFGLGCGGYGGFGGGSLATGGLGAGLFSDPVSAAYYPPGTGIANFLSLFAPGILQNSLAVTAPPQQFADYNQSVNNDLENDPEVDPNYRPGPAAVPVRRPNRVVYDSAGAPPVTPGQLVGGIATTVNGIIQQLTGNVQPVYG